MVLLCCMHLIRSVSVRDRLHWRSANVKTKAHVSMLGSRSANNMSDVLALWSSWMKLQSVCNNDHLFSLRWRHVPTNKDARLVRVASAVLNSRLKPKSRVCRCNCPDTISPSSKSLLTGKSANCYRKPTATLVVEAVNHTYIESFGEPN